MADIETVDHQLEDEQALAALADRAAMLESRIRAATDPDEIRALGFEASQLTTQVPQGYAQSATVQSRINAAVILADQRAGEAESDESGTAISGPMSAASKAFQKDVYKFMSQAEKDYFDQFKDNKQYAMAKINADGTIEETDQTVSGAQLKEDFARVKYHTLTDEQKAEMAKNGTTLPDGTTPAANMTPEQEAKELGKLEKSLDNLEGQKAQELLECGADKDDVKRCHEKFEGARDHVRGLRGRIEREQEHRRHGRTGEANMEKAKIQIDRGRMKEALQNAIDEGMLDNDQPAKEVTITGGQDMGRENLNQLAANISRNDNAGKREQSGGIAS